MHTVVITFDQPNARFLQATSTMSLGFFAASTVAASAEACCQGALTGTGPFVLKQFVHNQDVVLTRRNGYQWPSSLAQHQGESYPVLSRYQPAATSVLAKTTPLYQDLSAELRFDPQAAQKLLEENGWRRGADGIRSKNGQRLSFRISYWQSAPFIEVVQQQLHQVGIDLQLEKAPVAGHRRALGGMEPDLFHSLYSACRSGHHHAESGRTEYG